MGSTASRGVGITPPPNFPLAVPGSTTGGIIAGVGPIALAAGDIFMLPPGQYMVTPGPYTFVQVRDPTLNIWRTPAQTPNALQYISSDGGNYRLANLSGCAIGAYVTNVGSGYTSAPTVTSTGSTTWRAIVGGAINSTVTVTAGGLYDFPPLLVVSPPPGLGVQATAIAVLSAGAINSVTVIDQGAGYTVAPTITIIRDPRDTQSSNGVLTVNATLTGAGTVTAVICTNHGTAVTSVPTLTFSGGGGSSAAATAVMCFTATGFTVGTAGAVYGNAQPFLVITGGGIVGGAAGAVVNPSISTGILTPRQANISGTSTAGGAVTATGLVINDAGLFTAVPTGFVIPGGNGLPTTTAIVTITVGGTTDVSRIFVA